MSFINQFDWAAFDEAPDEKEFVKKKKPTLIPLSFNMVLNWDLVEPGSTTDMKAAWSKIPNAATVRFYSPREELLVEETDIPFVQSQMTAAGFTGVISVRNFPIKGWGRYEVRVSPNGFDDSEHSVKISLSRNESTAQPASNKKKKSKKEK